jgi:two-component system response regulator AtoC
MLIESGLIRGSGGASETGNTPGAPTIMVVDDDEDMRHAIRLDLHEAGYNSVLARSVDEALSILPVAHPDVVLTDVMMPVRNGFDLLRSVREVSPSLPVIMITVQGSIPLAVAAIQDGANDFITKPLQPGQIRVVVERSLEMWRRERSLERARLALSPAVTEAGIITDDAHFLRVIAHALRAARTDLAVLIEGETGTGKELIARLIHSNSRRSNKELVDLNCGALPESLLESELFGHKRGSFTNADRDHRGAFECADGSTLLLDEMQNAPMSMQIKLLRVLERGEFRRVGGTGSRRTNIRLVTTANLRLADEVARGQFREDLFHRISQVPIKVPPLRERTGDIPLLVQHFLEVERTQRGSSHTYDVDPEVFRVLEGHAWPGNVRQLLNTVRQMALAAGDARRMTVRHIPQEIRAQSASSITPSPVISILGHNQPLTAVVTKAIHNEEESCIREALNLSRGKVTEAAKKLGISRRTLFNKMTKYGISKTEYRNEP